MPQRTHDLGDNVTGSVSEDGKTLTLTVKLDAKGTTSASGKSVVIASTRGNIALGDVKIGLNIYRPAH